MNIAKRLGLLLTVPLAAFLTLGVIVDLNLRNIEKRGTNVADQQLPSVSAIGQIARKHAELRVDLRDVLLALGDKQRAGARAAFQEDERDLNRLLSLYGETLITDESNRQLLLDYRNLTGQWVAEAKALMALAETGQRQEATDRVFGPLSALGERCDK